MAGSEHAAGEYHPEVGHVTPVKLLVGVLCILLFLTVVTVAVAQVDLGPFNLFVALAVASVKAAFVVLFFMHLRWDKPFNSVIFISTILFLALFLGFCILDAKEYQKDVIQDYKSAELPQFESDKSE